jgi:hypothetical protein
MFRAMPAWEKAMEEVDKLDKSSVSEVKAYTKPPALVETVLQAIMILFGKPTDWATAKKVSYYVLSLPLKIFQLKNITYCSGSL